VTGVKLARLAKSCGLDGVVCSPHDIVSIKQACGADFMTVVPGVRPAGADVQDQKRVATPEAARAAGAEILVIGRPITQAEDPAAAASTIAQALGVTA
jgi:orotidine-5'-phosphate decarboxylase